MTEPIAAPSEETQLGRSLFDTHAESKAPAGRHTHASTKTVKNRLARVIGHMHAVERMLDDGRDCADILIQLAAIRSALNNICKIILRDHMDHCLIDAVRDNDEAALEELNKAVDLLMK